MYFIRLPWLIRKLYKNALYEMPQGKKRIYLTFDDGPIPEITPWILNILKEYNAHATFFCVGNNVAKHPEIYQQIISEQHAVGNHTFHHLNSWKHNTYSYF